MAKVLDAPVRLGGKAVALDAAKRVRDAFGDVGVAIVGHDQPAPRHQIHQTFEGSLNRFEVGINIGVVELDVGKNQPIGKVMQELGSLIEEGGVVLVAFEDEGARGAQLKAGAKILSDAADQERRIERRVFLRGDLVNPRQHAGGGGFAVRAGDDQRLAAREKLLMQQGGHRGKGNAVVEHALHFGIAARESIADHNQIGRGIKIGFGVRLQHRDAQRVQQVAHGRIGRLVGAGDAMALQLQKAGQRSHRCATNSAEVNVPGQ